MATSSIFARYGFNKAHAADYAIITVQTAYLKAHYPVEYMTALLTVEQSNTDKVGLLIAEARRMGIEVLPPNVNHSGLDFIIEDEPEEVKGRPSAMALEPSRTWAKGPVEAILAARDDGGPFNDLDDFCQRVDLRQVNRRALECLIKAGALEPLWHARPTAGRRGPHDQHQPAGTRRSPAVHHVRHACLCRHARLATDLPDVADASRKELLGWEKELIGAYISDHPLVARVGRPGGLPSPP